MLSAGTTDDRAFVPSGTVAPVVLEHPIRPQHDDLEVEAKAALDERSHRLNVMGRRWHSSTRPCRRSCSSTSAAPGPPTATHSSKLPIASSLPMPNCPLDHARGAGAVGAEHGPRVPHVAVVVVTPPVLHLPGVEDAHQLEVALRPVVALDQGRAAVHDPGAEAPAVGPGPRGPVRAPPVVQLAVGGADDHLEVAGGRRSCPGLKPGTPEASVGPKMPPSFHLSVFWSSQ